MDYRWRSGDRDRRNGQVNITTAEGKSYVLRYTLFARSVQFSGTGTAFAFAIEEMTRSKMVLNLGIQGQRLVCDRR